MSIQFSKLSKHFDRKSFDCGIDDLTQYIRRFARQNQTEDYSQCYILHKKEETEIIGYYTLTSSKITYKELPDEISKNIPKYGVGAVLIGRLAVNSKYQRKGYGKFLLMDALFRSNHNSESIGIWAVIVDAKNDDAELFYQKFGFSKLKDNDRRLFLPLRAVRALLPK